MSVENPAAHFTAANAHEGSLKAARSDCIDAFNAVDAAVRDLIERLDMIPAQSFCENLDRLQKMEPSVKLSAADKKSIEKRLSILRQLARFRHDIVHGKMTILAIDGEQQATFENVHTRSSFGTVERRVRFDDFASAQRAWKAAAQSFRAKGRPSSTSGNETGSD
ncbi:hypothetical protein [Qipengyuania sediminis]|uniref:hypothetical protein n=1 Tax=Qipengyuania sediminis TaxID=1532023 RepID=UPI00105A22D4|nr:hypothetical protein [Qipengyuania sediminis]